MRTVFQICLISLAIVAVMEWSFNLSYVVQRFKMQQFCLCSNPLDKFHRPHSQNMLLDTADQHFVSRAKLLPCPANSPYLAGQTAPNVTEPTVSYLEQKFPFLAAGGDYSPRECQAVERVAIVIPYRNRFEHLHILLNNLIPFLVRQQASFTIFVIEQELPSTFNRALLLNIGFLEALKGDNYTCFLFHDVDLIPLNDYNYYRCSSNPQDMVTGMNKWKYKLIYKTYYGGVTAITPQQFKKFNGNSNLYFGWGGEDDDLYARVVKKGMKAGRSAIAVGLYDMIKHEPDKGNDVNPVRVRLLKKATDRIDYDGLNTAKYHVENVDLKPLYTWIKVSINETEILTNLHQSVKPYLEKVLHPKVRTRSKVKPPSKLQEKPLVKLTEQKKIWPNSKSRQHI